MFAGHVGAALVLGRVERRVNVGVLVFAALWLDVVLWAFVLCGWERASIPADYASTHQVEFVFPYSHGLFAAVAWSALAGTAMLASRADSAPSSRRRAALLVAVAVASHWLLDALVHVPEMPLLGSDSMKVGLGLWRNMPLALALEGLVLAAGLWLFLAGRKLSKVRTVCLLLLSALLLALTVVGMTVAPPPPSVAAMAVSSLVIAVGVSVLVGWLARRPGYSP